MPEVQGFFVFFGGGGQYCAAREITCQTAWRVVKHQGYQIMRYEGGRGTNFSLPSVGGESRGSELSTNSMNTGALTDQWPVTQYVGRSRV